MLLLVEIRSTALSVIRIVIVEDERSHHYETASINYPFFDYDNVLDVTKVSHLDWMETSFHDGLIEAYEWFLVNRNQIVFKESVDRNLYEMIAELSI